MVINIPPKLQTSKWRYVIGALLIIIGSALMILPVGPGTFLILLGLYMINRDWADKKIKQWKKGMLKFKHKVKGVWKKIKLKYGSRS